MPSGRSSPAKGDELDARATKTLRYVVSCKTPPVTLQMASHCKIEWSDLPHTVQEAKMTLDQLREAGLVKRGEGGYTPTQAGTDYIKAHPHHTKHTYRPPKAKTKKKGK